MPGAYACHLPSTRAGATASPVARPAPPEGRGRAGRSGRIDLHCFGHGAVAAVVENQAERGEVLRAVLEGHAIEDAGGAGAALVDGGVEHRQRLAAQRRARIALMGDVAEKLLDEFGLKEANRVGSLWLAAMVALFNGNLPKASRLLGVYLGREAPTGTQEILIELLSEWDIRVATIGEANPALNFPALPSIVSGVTDVVRRPQYGERVLTMLPRENDVSLPSSSLLAGKLSLSQCGDASFFCSPRPDASSNAGWLTLAKPSQKQGDK